MLATWSCVQLVCLYQTGVRIVGDAPRYLGGAEALLAGQGLSPSAQPYSLTVALYALGLVVGPGVLGIVAIQVALSCIATLRIARAADVAYGSRAGLVAGLLFALWWEIQRRNFFLLTTSLFVSVSVLAVAQAIGSRTSQSRVLAGFLAVAAALLRPDGVLVGAAICVFWGYRWARGQTPLRRAIVAGLAAAVATLASAPLNAFAVKIRIPELFLNGTVIWGHEASRIEPVTSVPDSLATLDQPLRTAGWLLVEHPMYLAGLLAARLKLWVLHVKPYYSTAHNVFLAATYYPVYVLAAVGLRSTPRTEGVRLLLATWLLLQALFVSLTFEDWSGRWLLHVMPALFILAAAGVVRLVGDSPHRIAE